MKVLVLRLSDERPAIEPRPEEAGQEPYFIAISARLDIARSLRSRLHGDSALPSLEDTHYRSEHQRRDRVICCFQAFAGTAYSP